MPRLLKNLFLLTMALGLVLAAGHGARAQFQGSRVLGCVTVEWYVQAGMVGLDFKANGLALGAVALSPAQPSQELDLRSETCAIKGRVTLKPKSDHTPGEIILQATVVQDYQPTPFDEVIASW